MQWNWLGQFSEDHFKVILGLHVELVTFLNGWLDVSRWTDDLVLAGIAKSGEADSFIKTSRIY